jgi:outer membrane lipoprotein-sorting protein
MKLILCTILSLVLSATLSAQDAFRPMQDKVVFRSLADEIAKSTNTIQCEFTQEKHLSFMEHAVESQGKFYFAAQNQLRWEYTSPFSYIILMKADQLTIIDEGSRNDMAMGDHPAFKKVQKLLTTVLKGDIFAAETDFNMHFFENGTAYRIHLEPKQQEMKQYISGIELYFDKADMMLSAFEMHEQGGDMTRTVFTSRKINTTLPTGIFEVRK